MLFSVSKFIVALKYLTILITIGPTIGISDVFFIINCKECRVEKDYPTILIKVGVKSIERPF